MATILDGLGKGGCKNSKYLAKVLQLGTHVLILIATGKLSVTPMCPYRQKSFCSGVSDRAPSEEGIDKKENFTEGS